MPKLSNYREDVITSGGGTINYSVLEDKELYILSGTATLSSSWTIQSTGAPKKGMEFRIRKVAAVTLNGNNFTVFGEALTATQALKDCTITATYDGAAWEVIIKLDAQESGIIGTNELADEGVTDDKILPGTIKPNKMFAQASAGLLGFDEHGDCGFVAVGNGQLLIGNAGATGVAGVTPTGAISIDGSGVTSINSGVITEDHLAFSINSYQILERTLSHTELLGLSAVAPITLIEGQGAKTVINVLGVTAFLEFNSAAYTGGSDLTFVIGASTVATIAEALVKSGVSRYEIAGLPTVSTRTYANTPLLLGVSSAFLAGDSPIKLKIIYTVLDFN